MFCKYPEIGKVKTRLVNDKFSEEQAKELQIAMVIDTFHLLQSLSFSFQPVLSFYPPEKEGEFKKLLHSDLFNLSKPFLNNLMYVPQTSSSVGGRFAESFIKVFKEDDIEQVI